MIDKTKFTFTEIASKPKAEKVSEILKRENRFLNLIPYKKNGNTTYYIFFRNYK